MTNLIDLIINYCNKQTTYRCINSSTNKFNKTQLNNYFYIYKLKTISPNELSSWQVRYFCIFLIQVLFMHEFRSQLTILFDRASVKINGINRHKPVLFSKRTVRATCWRKIRNETAIKNILGMYNTDISEVQEL